MIFLQLFYVFSKIGIFNFGGGYAMLSLIYGEVVTHYHWITNSEFTDIVAISQSTPGPIGINAATYCGYTAIVNAGYPVWMACLGSVMASLSIMWLPFLLMIAISRYLIRHKDAPFVQDIFKPLRPAIIGLIAAAALLLMNTENFGSPSADMPKFIISVLIFLAAFFATRYKVANPILVMLACGILGLIIY